MTSLLSVRMYVHMSGSMEIGNQKWFQNAQQKNKIETLEQLFIQRPFHGEKMIKIVCSALSRVCLILVFQLTLYANTVLARYSFYYSIQCTHLVSCPPVVNIIWSEHSEAVDCLKKVQLCTGCCRKIVHFPHSSATKPSQMHSFNFSRGIKLLLNN